MCLSVQINNGHTQNFFLLQLTEHSNQKKTLSSQRNGHKRQTTRTRTLTPGGIFFTRLCIACVDVYAHVICNVCTAVHRNDSFLLEQKTGSVLPFTLNYRHMCSLPTARCQSTGSPARLPQVTDESVSSPQRAPSACFLWHEHETFPPSAVTACGCRQDSQ